MVYTECLAFELNNQFCHEILINEGNTKAKQLNKNIKIGNSFQYFNKEFSHRFIAWSIFNNIVKVTEYSTECELLGNQILIEFDKSQVINLNVFENGQTVDFLISTSLSVMRFSVHHPSKLRQPNKESQQYSIFYDNKDLNEIKHSISAYFDITEVTVSNSIMDYETNNAYFNYVVSNKTVFTVVMNGSSNAENISYFEMKEMSMLSKIFGGFLPKQRSFDYSDISILDMTYVHIANIIYLVTISRDNKLRIWNLKDKTCTVSEDLLPCVLESNNSNRSMTTINQSAIISSHKIKSFYANTNIDDYTDTVVVYFHSLIGKNTLNNWLVLRIMNPSDRSNSRPTQLCSNIICTDDDFNLLQFEIGFETESNDILGVWSLTSHFNDDKHNKYSLYWVPLIKESQSITCCLYNVSNELDLTIQDYQDAQEAIMNKIFSPHCFSRLAIINIINKNIENESYISHNASIDELKYNLVITVESKVEKNLSLYLSEDCDIDLIAFNRQQWLDIFQEIVEEHFSVMEPLSIILNKEIVGLNRFDTVSLMRRVNIIEQTLSGSTNKYLKDFFDENILSSADALLKHIQNTSSMLQSISGWSIIEHQLLNMCHSPIDICRQLSSNIDISSLYNFDYKPKLFDQTVNLLENFNFKSFQETMTSDLQSCKLSSLSISMLHYSTREVIRQRIFSSLTFLTMLMQAINSPHGSHLSKFIDRIVCLLKSLISVFWLLSMRQRTSLELTDVQKSQLRSINLLDNRYENDNGTDILCIKVLQLMQYKFKIDNYQSHGWHTKMNEEMHMIVNHLYPNGDSFLLLEICKYFLSYNLPMELIDYLKILMKSEPAGWWLGDECFVNAIIGLSYLLMNKPWKFVDYISCCINAADISSSLLPDIILNEDERTEIDSIFLLQSCLLMKFIEILENFDNSQAHIITMAKVGLKIINDVSHKNENVKKYKSILMTILFKNLLEIMKYDEAMEAIMNNPDVDKQKDCLRQFIMILCDHGQLNKLVGFNYGNLKEEFINIVTCRARSNDPTNSNDSFYNVLYSFHIRSGDIKSAATSMLELALRLDNDMKNCGPYLENCAAIIMLQNQIKAYLLCITSASLIPKDEQLFVFPAKITVDFGDIQFLTINNQTTEKSHCDNSNQMDLCEDMVLEEGTERSIINLIQIRRQYSLIKTRLKLLRESPEHGFVQSGKLSPSLTLTSLLQLGLYSDAISVCVDFKLDMTPIVNTIATHCAKVSNNCLDRPILKEKENVIDSLEDIDTNKTVDYASFGSLQKLLWKLLNQVLLRYDSSTHGFLYLRACSKLLSYGIVQLPSWLVNSVVIKNSTASLIKLYITNNLLELAVNLACRQLTERIDELHYLKDDIIYNGGKSLNKVQQTKWISYPIILNLLEILSLNKDHNEAKELFDKLNDKFKTMISILQIDNTTNAIDYM